MTVGVESEFDVGASTTRKNWETPFPKLPIAPLAIVRSPSISSLGEPQEEVLQMEAGDHV